MFMYLKGLGYLLLQSQRYRDGITGIKGPIRPLAFVLNLKHEAGISFRPLKSYQLGLESHCIKLHTANSKKGKQKFGIE